MKNLKQIIPSRWPLRVLYILAAVALLGDFLANEKPLFCVYKGKPYFPVVHQYAADLGLAQWPPELVRARWKDLDYEKVVFPPIPYSATTLDIRNSHSAHPFKGQRVESMRYWHWLGTDELGRDVAAGLISGTRIALIVGLGAMLLASLIGIALGAIAGYWGDRGLRTSWLRLLAGCAGLYFGLFYGFISRGYAIGEANEEGVAIGALLSGVLIFAAIMSVALLAGWGMEKMLKLRRRLHVPADLLVMRGIEVFESIPGLLLILSLAALIRKPSAWYVMLIIGLVGWTSIAQFVRAEMLKVRQQAYIEAARALGLPPWRIILRHALPNALNPVLILIAFGVARAILSEATLSFLGIGLGPDEVTWGKLLSEARSNFNAWWLAIFPGLAIFITVMTFNLLGERLSDALDPRREATQK